MTPSAPRLPERIKGLSSVVANLSWSWDRDARALLRGEATVTLDLRGS